MAEGVGFEPPDSVPGAGLKQRAEIFLRCLSTVGQHFAAKPRNSAQRTAKAELRITWHQQRYAKQ